MYKWEELEIIREDYFPSFETGEAEGLFFLKEKRIKQDIYIQHGKL